MSDLVERLRAACNGHPHAKIAWPHRILHEAADRIEALERELSEARALVAEANNSLYGSQGYFHSLNGGPFDKYHLATGIENLKASSREQWRALAASQAEASRLREALTYAAMGLGRIHDSLLSNGPKQASGEMAMHFRDKARAALSSGSKT